jgi:hypothetical protein
MSLSSTTFQLCRPIESNHIMRNSRPSILSTQQTQVKDQDETMLLKND